MEEGSAELRDPHITKCRVWQGVSIVGRFLGNLPLGLRVCCGVAGTLCRGHTERQVTASRATRAMLIEWLQKGCGVGTSASPSESRAHDRAKPVYCPGETDLRGEALHGPPERVGSPSP
ncbi:hypothetical protein HAX54_041163 [Datura stramonium]|uniref:Uncharacterized protein n=1 Tax=Datura stramonium TaxID=4076 RepID=A0ABS8SKZ6_DATST|nr:hypothetical protein [Datura stramonium]